MNNSKILNKADHEKAILSHKYNEKLVIFTLDIDDSKKIFGNEIKNKIINIVLNEIANCFPTFYIAQYGRDAFVAFSNQDMSVFEIAKQKQILQDNLSNKFNFTFTFCMGIAVYPDNCKNVERLLAVAFEALFQAKQESSNSIVMNSETPMKLKSLYFRLGQLKQLEHYSKKVNKSESVIIRDALDYYLQKKLFD